MTKREDTCSILYDEAYSRLLCKRSAIGASGVMMIRQVSGTLTSRMAFRFTFFRFDFDPSVATNLQILAWAKLGKLHDEDEPYRCHASLARRKDWKEDISQGRRVMCIAD